MKNNDLNYIVTHSVVSNKYMHHMIVIDKSGNLLKYSKPFSFEGESIEFCLSFEILKNCTFQFHYSLWDGCTKSMDVKIDFFNNHYINV